MSDVHPDFVRLVRHWWGGFAGGVLSDEGAVLVELAGVDVSPVLHQAGVVFVVAELVVVQAVRVDLRLAGVVVVRVAVYIKNKK